MKENSYYIVNTDIENMSNDTSVLNEYSNALELDNYDHQCMSKPEGNPNVKELSYEECCKVIDLVGYGDNSKIKEVLEVVHQYVNRHELNSTLEGKASALLYFMIKDSYFSDYKRIGATLFLVFLNKNNALFKEDGSKIISDNDLASITLMIAISDPNEKDIVIRLVMTLLHINGR